MRTVPTTLPDWGLGHMPRSILIIDDDSDIRISLRQLLTDEGYTVYTAEDGHRALQVLERIGLPDLILLDYKMPVMDGKQFLAELRRIERWRTIPVVVLSAKTREWSGARLEVADVLSKPVDIDLLLSTVRSVCDGGVLHKRGN